MLYLFKWLVHYLGIGLLNNRRWRKYPSIPFWKDKKSFCLFLLLSLGSDIRRGSRTSYWEWQVGPRYGGSGLLPSFSSPLDHSFQFTSNSQTKQEMLSSWFSSQPFSDPCLIAGGSKACPNVRVHSQVTPALSAQLASLFSACCAENCHTRTTLAGNNKAGRCWGTWRLRSVCVCGGGVYPSETFL